MVEQLKRCQWVEGKPDFYLNYHDQIWAKAEHDDRLLFEWLILESFHVGLSWQLVLSKRQAFQEAFDQFDYKLIAKYGEEEVDRLAQNSAIIRHRGKIRAAISNAQAFIRVQEEFGSFDTYIWSFSQGQQIIRQADQESLTHSPLSDQVTQDMKKRGFKFIGSITIYSYLQAIGIINDHEIDCDFR